jgi:ABC-type polysaccharide/polyol phosphate transport system ATPase subunit
MTSSSDKAKEIAIEVNDVEKIFKLPHEKNSSIKSTVLNFYRKKELSKNKKY